MALEVDWKALTGLAVAAGAGIGAVLKGVWERIWRNKDRRVERDEARDEIHRNELRHAYIEFTTAMSKYLDAGFLVARQIEFIESLQPGLRIAHSQSIYGQEQKAQYQAALENLANERRTGETLVLAFAAASTDAEAKAASVRMLDEDAKRGEDAWNLARESLSTPSSEAESTAFRDLLRLCRARLEDLIKRLGGEFAPRRWDTRPKPPATTTSTTTGQPTRESPPTSTTTGQPASESPPTTKGEK